MIKIYFESNRYLLTFTIKIEFIMSQTVLSLKEVTIYQEGRKILSHINLDVQHGEFIYII